MSCDICGRWVEGIDPPSTLNPMCVCNVDKNKSEELIHCMLDEMERGTKSKYSIIEKYFKRVREDTKRKCLIIFQQCSPFEAAEKIRKL